MRGVFGVGGLDIKDLYSYSETLCHEDIGGKTAFYKGKSTSKSHSVGLVRITCPRCGIVRFNVDGISRPFIN